MAEEYRVVDLWVGAFASEDDFRAYLSESYDEDDGDTPISRFAADQGQDFLDHDFIESGFHATAGDLADLIATHSFAASYRVAASDAFVSSGVGSANAVVLAFGRAVSAPRSVEHPSYTLTYLGRFACDPAAASDAPGDGGIPPQVHLIPDGGPELQLDGRPVASVPIDSRGLVIGRGAPASGTPRLDVSPHVEGVAADQVRIYRDRFDQWIIEDVGGNGLTRIDGRVLDRGRTFPWHGQRLSIGTLHLEWVT